MESTIKCGKHLAEHANIFESNVQIIDCNIEGLKIDGILAKDLLEEYRRRDG